MLESIIHQRIRDIAQVDEGRRYITFSFEKMHMKMQLLVW